MESFDNANNASGKLGGVAGVFAGAHNWKSRILILWTSCLNEIRISSKITWTHFKFNLYYMYVSSWKLKSSISVSPLFKRKHLAKFDNGHTAMCNIWQVSIDVTDLLGNFTDHYSTHQSLYVYRLYTVCAYAILQFLSDQSQILFLD